MLNTAQLCTEGAEEVLFIADACLGGLRGRSTLLIGPEEHRQIYVPLLQKAEVKNVYQEDTPLRAAALIPAVQLLISVPGPAQTGPSLTAGVIAQGCVGRRTPLLIFDLSESTPSVEDLAGLLPTVCLYTPEDLRQILSKRR